MSELLDTAGTVSNFILLVLLQGILGQKSYPALAPSWSLSGVAPKSSGGQHAQALQSTALPVSWRSGGMGWR